MVVCKRYAYDSRPVLELNSLQLAMKTQIDEKVGQGLYRFETVPCPICLRHDLDKLAEKDRYGLGMVVAICRTCGLIQTNPRMTQESYTQFYNEEYRKLYEDVDVPEERFRQQYGHGQVIFEYLEGARVLTKPPREVFVLEVGCGAGGILKYFQDMGYRVKGIDVGQEYLYFGKRRHHLDLSVATLAGIQFERSPDVVIYSHVLEHILAPSDELALVRQVIANGGILYVEAPGVKNLIRNYEADFLQFLQNAHVYHFSLTTLTSLMHICGFQLLLGDEGIRSIFAVATHESHKRLIANDYDDVLTYLRRVEALRRLLPFPPNAIPRTAKRFVARTLRAMGLYASARRLYRKVRRAKNG